MFSDRAATTGADYPSCWRKELSVREGSCQTEPRHSREVATQSSVRSDADSQTWTTAPPVSRHFCGSLNNFLDVKYF